LFSSLYAISQDVQVKIYFGFCNWQINIPSKWILTSNLSFIYYLLHYRQVFFLIMTNVLTHVSFILQGSECPFNHDFRPPKRFELCKYYVHSYCTKGNDCVFMHDILYCYTMHGLCCECYNFCIHVLILTLAGPSCLDLDVRH
jgi:hypothetical protein